MFKDKVLLITGGTGSFGNAVLDRFLDTDIKEIRILSIVRKIICYIRAHLLYMKIFSIQKEKTEVIFILRMVSIRTIRKEQSTQWLRKLL